MTKQAYKFQFCFSKWVLCFILAAVQPVVFAQTLVITGKKVIEHDTTYNHAKLDLTRGYFEVQNQAKLELNNCIVTGTLTPEKRSLINLIDGALVLKNNQFEISALDIPENPKESSIFTVLNISQGGVTIMDNDFTINQPYTASLLVARTLYTQNFKITGNRVSNFHGGFILKNSHAAYIAYNKFTHLSTTNILLLNGSDSVVEKNEILFAGNNNIGDGIDIIDSENILLNENFIASGSCYSVVILRGKDITLQANRIIGGITYAIYISGSAQELPAYLWAYREDDSSSPVLTRNNNQNIRIISNYLAQNRYGLTATNVVGLVVENNLFIQKFENAESRKFWTNNDVLLKNVINSLWLNNWYKEAYAQNAVDVDIKSSQLSVFPARGGVQLKAGS